MRSEFLNFFNFVFQNGEKQTSLCYWHRQLQLLAHSDIHGGALDLIQATV